MQVQAIAQAGLDAALDRLNTSAWRTATDPSGDAAREVAADAEAVESFRANLAVMKTADQMDKAMLDIKV